MGGIIKYLITGGAGFIGSHLVEYFSKKRINVVAYDKYHSKGDYGWLENNKNIGTTKIILGDINDYTLTNKGFVWVYPGKPLIKNCIAVLPEKYKQDLSICYGVCTDNIKKYYKDL